MTGMAFAYFAPTCSTRLLLMWLASTKRLEPLASMRPLILGSFRSRWTAMIDGLWDTHTHTHIISVGGLIWGG